MTGSTRFTFYFLLFLYHTYQSVEALPSSKISPYLNSINLTNDYLPKLPETKTHSKLTKREEALIRKIITHELENKTVLNAVTKILSAYVLENPEYLPNAPLVIPPFNQKSLKQKYKLRKPPRTTTPDWDQSLEEFISIVTTLKPTQPTSTTPTTTTSTPTPSSTSSPSIPSRTITDSPSDAETIVEPEATSKKYVVLTLYAGPPPPPSPPPSSLYIQPQQPPYSPLQYTTPLPPPPTTTLPWYKTAPNIFDPQQVGPILTDIVVGNINNGLIPNFLWNQAVDFAQGDGARVTGILLECIFLPPCPT